MTTTPQSRADVSVAAAASLPGLPVAPSGQTGRALGGADAASKLKVKRFVVANRVADREPVTNADALLADGSAIYAFAELSNPAGPSENVRITFERKGGRERVGDVTLPVPGNAARHRTWAFTRFIRVPGVWEAVLWSEGGVELSRTSFEVTRS